MAEKQDHQMWQQYNKKIEQAREFTSKNKYFEAIAIYEELEDKYPFVSIAYIDHSYILMRNLKKYHEAASIANLGLDRNPASESIKRNLAEALSHIPGEELLADTYFRQLIGVNPNDARILSSYADFLVRYNRFEDARKIYYSILEKTKNRKKITRTRVDLARSYRFDNQPEKSLEILVEDPVFEDPFWLKEISNCFIEKGDGESASYYLERAKKSTSTLPNGEAKKYLLQLESLEKSTRALLGDWREVLEWTSVEKLSEPVYKSIWHTLRKVLLGFDDKEKIIDILLETLRKYPNDPRLAQEISRFVTDAGFPNEEISNIVKKAFAISPENPSVLEMLAEFSDSESGETFWTQAWAAAQNNHILAPSLIVKVVLGYSRYFRNLGKYDEALVALDQAKADMSVDDWDVDLERAICLGRQNNHYEAVSVLRRLDNIKPNNPVVLDQLGISLRSLGELEEALSVFRKKIEIQDDLHGRQGLARTLFEMGSFDEAEKIFKLILEDYPSDAEAKWHYANILLAKGEVESAQKLFSELKPQDLAIRGRQLLDGERIVAELRASLLSKEAEIEQGRKLAYLGTMATATAHELNQPIGIIRAIADSALVDIRDKIFKDDEIKPLLEKILYQTDRLGRIIENLRAFARNDRTKRELVDVNNVIQKVANMFDEQFKHRGIEMFVELNYKNPAPVAWANPVQIEEVLINLLTNARDAVEGRDFPKVIIICWRHKSGSTGFSVEDNGSGLSNEFKSQIFTPFVSSKPTEKGTGLGLFISKKIISDLGGRLFFEEVKDGGVRFIVHLPRVERRQELYDSEN